jgi:hypothetical protein
MPPALRNNRTPPDGDIPASTAACSLERPTAIAAQNCLQFSRHARFHNFIATSFAKVLRRSVESALGRPVKPDDDSGTRTPSNIRGEVHDFVEQHAGGL